MNARAFPIYLVASLTITSACSGENAAVGKDIILTDVSCKACSVRAESVAFLGHDEDTVAIAQENLPAMDSRGRFYVGAASGGAVHVFAPTGRLMKSFGKRGNGPAEFMRINEIHITPLDTLLVVAGSAVHVLSPDYEHVRQFPRPDGAGEGWSSTMLSDGRVLHMVDSAGFRTYNSSGTVSERVVFQEQDTTKCQECRERTFREGTTAGSFWSAPHGAYSMDNYDLEGKLIQRIVRKVDWFIPRPLGQRESVDDIAEFAKPRLLGVRQGSDGILWAHVMMIEDTESLKGIAFDSPAQMAKVLEKIITRVEAIDPKEKKVIAGTRLTQAVFPMRGDYSAQLVPDPSGDWAWKILKFSVSR